MIDSGWTCGVIWVWVIWVWVLRTLCLIPYVLYVGVILVEIFVTWTTEYRHAVETNKGMGHL